MLEHVADYCPATAPLEIHLLGWRWATMASGRRLAMYGCRSRSADVYLARVGYCPRVHTGPLPPMRQVTLAADPSFFDIPDDVVPRLRDSDFL